ncbi:MAG TPA: hypothetical protein VGI81_11610 [Tepidisphaeraceae bacterium]|jgi:hypothetical protein
MNREELEAQMQRQPFVPLRLHLRDHRKFDVPFNHVIVFRSRDFILFKGVKKEGSRVAKGYEVIPYDQIDRILPNRGGTGRRRKAS